MRGRPIGGRDALVATIAARAAAGAGVVLVADDGCGATTLLRAVAERVRADGRPVGEVAGAPHRRATPGGALVGPGSGPGSGQAAAGPDGAADGDGPTAATLAATAAVEAMVAPEGAVVVVDDAQWLDETSAALLGAVGVEGRAGLVVGVRAGDRLPVSLAPLLRDPDVTRLSLGPLAAGAVADALEAAWGAPVTEAVVARALAVCDGRPGPLAEVATTWPEAGAVAVSRGVWDLVRAVDPPLPPGDHALPSAGPERAALTIVALAGTPPAAAVERVVGLDVLDRLERGGVVEVDDGAGPARLRLARPSAGLVAARTLDASEQRVAFAALVSALAPDDAVDLVDRATWTVAAGGVVPGPEALAAARLALDRGDAPRAELLAGVASTDPAHATEAAVVEALARWRQGRVAEALARLDALAADRADPARLDVLRARLLVRAHATDDVEEARRAAEEALAAADDATAHGLGPTLAYLTLLAGWPTRADAAARTWLAAAAADDPGRDQAEVVRTFAALQAGRRPEPPPPPARSDDTVMRWRRGVEVGIVLAALHRGEVAAAAVAADEFGRAAEAAGDRLFGGWGAVVSGMARLQAGQLRQAQADWVRAWRTFVPLGLGSRLRPVRAGLRVVEALGGAGVRDLAGLGWFDAVPEGPGMLLAGEQARYEVLLALVEQRPDVAARAEVVAAVRPDVAERAEVVAATLDRRGMAASAAAVRHLHSLAEPRRSDVVAALAADASALATAQARAWAADAAARHEGDEAAHLAAVDDLLGLGDALSAHLSLLAARAERPSRVLDDRLRALAAATDLPGPARLATPAVPRLTPRELEVARRVAAGASSRAVAEELGVSPRTVDATLAKVYRKLGIHRRTDVPAALGPDAPEPAG